MKSAYIHIPFCKDICSYCDFCKMYYNENLVDQYLLSLEKEIRNNYKGEILDTIYIGGGTPSCLSPEQLKKLFKIISLFKTSSRLEFTFEVNFDSCSEEKLILLKKNKVNRLSFGIETFNQTYLKQINRKCSYDEVKQKIHFCKKLGFTNINIDLMYGFKGQTLDELKEDIIKVLSLDIEHISTYSLIVEEHTKLYIDNYERINDELDSKMYYFIIDYLEKHGFYHYEISNFCKKKKESQHNLTYWNNEEYYGFGLSASGYYKDKRYTNTRSLNKYLLGDCMIEQEEIKQEDKMIYEMILGLRKTSGVNKNKFFQKYNLTIDEKFDIMNLIENKLLIDDGTHLFIPRDKLYVANSILIHFLGGSDNE